MIILLVEDDPAQLKPLCIALSESGHLVDGVEDAEEADAYKTEKNVLSESRLGWPTDTMEADG